MDSELPSIYVALGSSGRGDLLPMVVEALAQLPVTLMVSTAGKKPDLPKASNVYSADYLPGDAASQQASLILCNGGSLTTYQAFAYGRPVLGIAGNLDQHLNMSAVEALGAGKRLRTDRLSANALTEAASYLLEVPTAGEAADGLRQYMRLTDPHDSLLKCLREVM